MLKRIVIVILVVVVIPLAIILGLAMTKPDSFRVQRSASINAPPERIFPLISDFDRWTAWSPYEKLDPDLKRTRSGAPRGKGVYEWEGNTKVGKGRMEIIDESPPNRVLVKLDFLKPFEAHNTAEFTLQPAGETTNVTWAMTGPNLFIGKVMSVFINMDRMVGKDFETGLANLKAIAESDTAKP